MCDGYAQCDDESDEDHDLCSECPKGNGWPFRPEEKRLRATFTCKHRYNINRTICATPCDGIDDMCLDYADEDNCSIPSFLDLLSHVGLVTMLTGIVILGITFLVRKYLKREIKHQDATGKVNLTFATIGPKDEKEIYQAIRRSEEFGMAVQNFILHIWNSNDINSQQQECIRILEMEAEMHKSEEEANIHIMKYIGTNDCVGRAYDLLEKSLSVQIEEFFFRTIPGPIYKMLKNYYIKIARSERKLNGNVTILNHILFYIKLLYNEEFERVSGDFL